ncbi:unnamed protein product [Symbiodinium sp. CCMP2592]|nr:unnamed protein product [Symbiodinium sp. CCMP2592]
MPTWQKRAREWQAQLKEVIVAEVREEPPGFPCVWKLFNAEFRSSFERRERHIASTKCFNALIMTMVVVNTLLVGIEVDFAIEVIAWDRFGFVFLEGLFCLLFTTELALRIHQQGWAFFEEFLNLLDYSLVVISWLDVAVSVITYRERVQFASTVRVFRFVRFIRLAEGRFFGLFKIAKGLANALQPVVYLAIIAAAFIFTAAAFLTGLVAHDWVAINRWEAARMYAGSVWRSVLTVMQIATFDNWAELTNNLVEAGSPLTLIVVLGSIFGCSFAIINSLVGIMVERVSNISADAAENQELAAARAYEMLLQSLLVDLRYAMNRNGKIDFEAYWKLLNLPSIREKLSIMGITPEEAEVFFALMDVDKTGQVTPVQLVNALGKAKGKCKSHDMCALICIVHKQCLRASRSVDRVHRLIEKVDQIQHRLFDCGRGLTRERLTAREADVRAEAMHDRAADRERIFQKAELQKQVAQARMKVF